MSRDGASPDTYLPRFANGVRPLVNRLAAIRASVQTKLRAGFLLGAALLVVMAALSLAVQAHMSDRVSEINLASADTTSR